MRRIRTGRTTASPSLGMQRSWRSRRSRTDRRKRSRGSLRKRSTPKPLHPTATPREVGIRALLCCESLVTPTLRVRSDALASCAPILGAQRGVCRSGADSHGCFVRAIRQIFATPPLGSAHTALRSSRADWTLSGVGTAFIHARRKEATIPRRTALRVGRSTGTPGEEFACRAAALGLQTGATTFACGAALLARFRAEPLIVGRNGADFQTARFVDGATGVAVDIIDAHLRGWACTLTLTIDAYLTARAGPLTGSSAAGDANALCVADLPSGARTLGVVRRTTTNALALPGVRVTPGDAFRATHPSAHHPRARAGDGHALLGLITGLILFAADAIT